VVDFTAFGKEEIKTWGHSPDAVVQVALILAFANLDTAKRLPGVYEACSVSKFLHGRTETIRSLTEPAAVFVRAAQHATSSLSSSSSSLSLSSSARAALGPLLHAATAAHRQNSVEAAEARGLDRHMLALQQLARREGVQEPLFGEPLYARSKRWLLSTSNVTADFIKYFAFGAVDPDGCVRASVRACVDVLA
jgi:carnitine O-acetyltransferase